MIYNYAAELSSLLEQTDEYKLYEEAKKQLLQDNQAFALFSRFRHDQFQLRAALFAGEDVEPELDSMNEYFSCICMEKSIDRFVSAETAFMSLLSGVQAIFHEKLDLWPGLEFSWSQENNLLN